MGGGAVAHLAPPLGYASVTPYIVLQRDIWKSYGRISIKFNGSIAAGTWTNWLGFEPECRIRIGVRILEPDYTEFLNFNGISEEVTDRFWWNLMWQSRRDLIRFWAGSGSEFRSWNWIYTVFWILVGYLKSWLLMKFYGSIAAGVCTIWLRFERDPDESPDPARRRALKVMDGFNEISWMNSLWITEDCV